MPKQAMTHKGKEINEDKIEGVANAAVANAGKMPEEGLNKEVYLHFSSFIFIYASC